MSPEEEAARTLGERLRRLGLTLATAESCTGGLVGHLLTEVPGSSDYYRGGVVAYANDVKERQLGVSAETLARHGAVSEQTVLEMARGVRLRLRADIGVAISGVAGPGGGSAEKPVGLVWLGLAHPDGELARRFLFPGDRSQVKRKAAEAALGLILQALEG